MYYQKHLFVCTNQKKEGKTCCANAGSEAFAHYLKSQLIAKNLYGPSKVRVSTSGCLGRCSLGPCMVVYPDAVWYTYSSYQDIDNIINQHLLTGKTVEKLVLPEINE